MRVIRICLLMAITLLVAPATKAQTMEENLQAVASFIKECHVFFIATVDEGQPRVRPFGVAEVVDGKLRLTTGRTKDVYKQILANDGRFELCALKSDNSEWVRVSGRLVDDDDAAVRQILLDRHPYLKNRYSANDGFFVTPYVVDGEARFFTFAGEQRRVKF